MNNVDSPIWTKFVCSLGPVSFNPEIMEGLVAAGADVLRVNFAHIKYEEYQTVLATLNDINKRLGTKTKLEADLQGPNIRVGSDIPEDGMPITAGAEYTFYTAAGEKEEGDIFINDQTLHLDVKAGEPITFMDGALEGEILWVKGHRMGVKMTNGGKLKPRKSVNVPETVLSSPALTEKDYRDLEFLLKTGVDYIALSFVSTRNELDEVRKMIGDRPIKMIAKIERREALKHLPEIMDATDIVMIARGDLGIEMPLEDIPVLQRSLTTLAAFYKKPVITATQMMLSMVDNLRPTRAEVSDVANAVYARSDAVMLSEETAVGVDPVNALKTMQRIARRVEDDMHGRVNYFDL